MTSWLDMTQLGRRFASRPVSGPFVITFSGIDGAGKTTQIERLRARLESQGYKVALFTFWNHVAFLPGVRASLTSNTARAARAASTAAVLAAKNNKNVRAWYLNLIRAGLYALDVVRLRGLLRTLCSKDYDFVVFDRYVYDQLATIYSQRPALRAYGRALVRLTPRPDLAILLDAAPMEAFRRKPEYPPEFMYSYRKTFLTLREIIPYLVTVPPSSIEEVEANVARQLHERYMLQTQPIKIDRVNIPSVDVR